MALSSTIAAKILDLKIRHRHYRRKYLGFLFISFTQLSRQPSMSMTFPLHIASRIVAFPSPSRSYDCCEEIPVCAIIVVKPNCEQS